MLIELIRDVEQPQYSNLMGKLYVDGIRACESAEGFGKELIPRGRYRVLINKSPQIGYDLPKLLSVPGFDDVRIAFNKFANSEGWVLVGIDRKSDVRHGSGLIGGQVAFHELFQDIREALNSGEQVWITVS